MNIRKLKKSFRKDMRAISPIIATLLMIAIAVVAALVVYAWVMGYMNFTTTKTGKSIEIQSVDNVTGTVYVQNVGNSAVIFQPPCVYVNGAVEIALPTMSPVAGTSVNPGGTVSILGITAGSLRSGDVIKVTSTDGTFSQYTIP